MSAPEALHSSDSTPGDTCGKVEEMVWPTDGVACHQSTCIMLSVCSHASLRHIWWPSIMWERKGWVAWLPEGTTKH